jgi:hypothetical protein
MWARGGVHLHDDFSFPALMPEIMPQLCCRDAVCWIWKITRSFAPVERRHPSSSSISHIVTAVVVWFTVCAHALANRWICNTFSRIRQSASRRECLNINLFRHCDAMKLFIFSACGASFCMSKWVAKSENAFSSVRTVATARSPMLPWNAIRLLIFPRTKLRIFSFWKFHASAIQFVVKSHSRAGNKVWVAGLMHIKEIQPSSLASLPPQ